MSQGRPARSIEDRIVKRLKAQPAMTVSQLKASLLKVDPKTFDIALDNLEEAKTIRRAIVQMDGSPHGTTYYFLDTETEILLLFWKRNADAFYSSVGRSIGNNFENRKVEGEIADPRTNMRKSLTEVLANMAAEDAKPQAGE